MKFFFFFCCKMVFALKPRPEWSSDFFIMVTKSRGEIANIFAEYDAPPPFLPIIWIKFPKSLLSRELNRINFPKTPLTHELIRFNFSKKMSHEPIRINFPQKLLSHESIRIKLLRKLWTDSTQLSKFPIWFESKKSWVEHKSDVVYTVYYYFTIDVRLRSAYFQK